MEVPPGHGLEAVDIDKSNSASPGFGLGAVDFDDLGAVDVDKCNSAEILPLVKK